MPLRVLCSVFQCFPAALRAELNFAEGQCSKLQPEG
jgi:hypothetical protein